MLKAAVQVHFLFVFSCCAVFSGRALSLRKEWLRLRSGDNNFLCGKMVFDRNA